MNLFEKGSSGIQCKCNGCNRTIKPKEMRETVSGCSEGQFFTKTLCERCIKDVVEQFRAEMKKREDEKNKAEIADKDTLQL